MKGITRTSSSSPSDKRRGSDTWSVDLAMPSTNNSNGYRRFQRSKLNLFCLNITPMQGACQKDVSQSASPRGASFHPLGQPGGGKGALLRQDHRLSSPLHEL
ncbi:uncharacterized protein LOC144115290 isoform X3 [Amblyomma americanum]